MPPARKTKAEKSNKKPLAEKMNQNNIYYQDDGNDGENNDEKVDISKDELIMRLQEEIRKLTIENTALKKKNNSMRRLTEKPLTPKSTHVNESNTPVRARRNSTNFTKTKERGCSCTGSCANKKCGCVKKDASCTEFCRCSDTCQNQMPDIDEEKENQGEGNIHSDSETEIQTPTSDNDKRSKNSSYSSNASTQTEDNEQADKNVVNPMKPTRQLARSPLHQLKTSPNSTGNTTVFNDDDVFLPVPKKEEEVELPPPDEINQMEVNWEEHQAKLVECRKCKRRFHPYRIKKHEQSCKNI